MLSFATYDMHIDRLLGTVKRLAAALDNAGIPYKVVGGLATFLHVRAASPLGARATNDVDAAVYRSDLQRIVEAVKPYGFRYRHAAGMDMLLQSDNPKAANAVHLVFIGEKVRPEYVEPVPESFGARSEEGVWIASVSDLLRMKLTSFRLKDKVHVQDLDEAGLITAEIEASLSPILQQRLAEVRASE